MKLATALFLFPLLAFARGPKDVSRVYTYTCNNVFFEGEGVTRGSISCVPGQHLGVLMVKQTFYFYQASHESSAPAGDESFASDVCKRNTFLRTQCTGNTPHLAFGLSADKTAEFPVAVELPAGPGKTVLMGYGAEPGKNGECPGRLEKAKTWVAKLKPLAHALPNNLPLDGGADDTVIAASRPSHHLVTRQGSRVPCDAATGDCINAQFAGAQSVESVPFKAEKGMSVCVLPAREIAGDDEGSGAGSGEDDKGPSGTAE